MQEHRLQALMLQPEAKVVRFENRIASFVPHAMICCPTCQPQSQLEEIYRIAAERTQKQMRLFSNKSLFSDN